MSVVKSGLALIENRFEYVLHLLVQYLFTATSYEEALPPPPPSTISSWEWNICMKATMGNQQPYLRVSDMVHITLNFLPGLTLGALLKKYLIF